MLSRKIVILNLNNSRGVWLDVVSLIAIVELFIDVDVCLNDAIILEKMKKMLK